jgi:hypothetical protein
VWFAGQPSEAVLQQCADITGQAGQRHLHVMVAPDADLGGARIVARLLAAMPHELDLELIDVGSAPHPAGKGFSDPVRIQLERLLIQFTNDQSGPYSTSFATYLASILRRGHVVEQEATIRASIDQATLRRGSL